MNWFECWVVSVIGYFEQPIVAILGGACNQRCCRLGVIHSKRQKGEGLYDLSRLRKL